MALVKTTKGLELGTPGIGKTLILAPKYEAAGQILDKAAEDGHYYPMMAMKQLRALSTGLSGKDNVFKKIIEKSYINDNYDQNLKKKHYQYVRVHLFKSTRNLCD